MNHEIQVHNNLLLKIHDLNLRLEEAQEALRAIRRGEVDALVIRSGPDERVCTLKDADHVYRSLIEHMNEGALVVQSDRTILYANKRFAEMVDSSPEKVIGATIDRFIAAEDRQIFDRLFEQGRQDHSKGEISLTADPADRVPVLVSISGIPKGLIQDVCVVLVTEVTALRQAQEELQKARDEMEARVVERTEELLRANAALAEADRRKNEFLAMLAHELRNPLAPIRNVTHVLQRKGPQSSDFQAPLEMIARQSQHLARLVDDLLDVSRLTRGKINLEKQPVDLVPIIAQVVENHRPSAEKQEQQITVNLPPHPIRIEGDDVRLTQIVSNLLNNALKYTPSGGQIRVALTEADGEAILSVRDNGIGMTREALDCIFDLFVQVDQGLDRAHGGLGIGLSLVRRLTEMHGGRIEAHSEGLGRGSEFILHFPLFAPAADRPPSAAAAPTDPGAPENASHVLVVDDNKDAAESLAELLELEGYRIRTAYDGNMALEACRTEKPGVVLLDLGLPGIDGFEVARQLRREYSQNPPILIAVTGYGHEDYRERAREAGFDHYLVKPVHSETVLDLLASLERGK